MKRRRKKALPPRVKRMKREGRLQSARSWLPTYPGKNIVAGYRKHFGVDWLCAFNELEMLGVKIDARYKCQVLQSVSRQLEARKQRKAKRAEAQMFFDQDENFAYIAGYTEGGFPYGVTWDELERSSQADYEMELGDYALMPDEREISDEPPDMEQMFNSLPDNVNDHDDIPF